ATFDTLAELVTAGVDVVVISTPLASRRALILEAIELGVAVVSDKPFAADAAQARELVEAAERRGVLLSVYQNRRWDSDFLTVRKLIDSGARR
ncbi:Gfo/Idh/MocA family oxidoreductase, partial [Pseudomonas coronafaciens pv. garcae]